MGGPRTIVDNHEMTASGWCWENQHVKELKTCAFCCLSHFNYQAQRPWNLFVVLYSEETDSLIGLEPAGNHAPVSCAQGSSLAQTTQTWWPHIHHAEFYSRVAGVKVMTKPHPLRNSLDCAHSWELIFIPSFLPCSVACGILNSEQDFKWSKGKFRIYSPLPPSLPLPFHPFRTTPLSKKKIHGLSFFLFNWKWILLSYNTS